jgi:hypothetical protein
MLSTITKANTKTMNDSYTLFATAVLCLALNSQAQTTAPSTDNAGTPPIVGELPLVLRDGVDPAKLDALVADTRRRSSEMRAQGYKDALANRKTSLPWLAPWIIATLHEGDKAKEANAWLQRNPNAPSPKQAARDDQPTRI